MAEKIKLKASQVIPTFAEAWVQTRGKMMSDFSTVGVHIYFEKDDDGDLCTVVPDGTVKVVDFQFNKDMVGMYGGGYGTAMIPKSSSGSI